MKWLCICLVFLMTLLSCGCSRDEGRHDKFRILENKVTVLTNELKALKEDVAVLKGEPTSEPDPDLLPLEASRTMLQGGRVRFTLKYKAKPSILEKLGVFWSHSEGYMPIEESFSNEIPRLPPDVYESSIEMEASNTSEVYAYVGWPAFWYRLTIRNALEGDATQLITSLPEAHVTPPDDIVYEPGTNATMQITIPFEEDRSDNPDAEDSYYTTLDFFLNRPGTDDIIESHRENDVLRNFYQSRDLKTFLDKREASIVFNTSRIAYSGLVMVSTTRRCHNNLLRFIENNFQLTLRPSNQSGPFREGLLAFLPLFWLPTNNNGDQITQCRSGEWCRVICQVFGNSPNEVVMLRTVNGIAETIIPPRHQEGEYTSYAVDVFRMTPDSALINYTCIGSDAGGQHDVSTTMIHLFDPPTFVDNQTNIEVLEGADVNVTCTATGTPLPQMDISFFLEESEPDGVNIEVLYQTSDTISVSRVVNLHDFDPHMLYALASFNFASCKASNFRGTSTKGMRLTLEQIDDYLPNLIMTF